MEHIVYLGLGSNLGARAVNLQAALTAMSPFAQVLRSSPIYITPPWGFLDQPDFLNQVLEISTLLSPLSLLTQLKHIEKDLGRTPAVLYGPRLIDIDILLYDELVLDCPQLTIPHPHMIERAFVLVPLCDLSPHLNHPILHKSFQELLSALDTSQIKPFHSDL